MQGKTVTGMRIVLGLLMTFAGTNKLFHFVPEPEHAEAAAAFLKAMSDTGYFIPFLGIVEVAIGIALLFGIFVPLALAVLAPITVNIVLFHAALDPAGIGGAVLVAVLNVALAYAYRDRYADMIGAL